MLMINDDQLYTLIDVSNMTGMSVKTIRRRMNEGKLTRVTAKREKVKFWGHEIKKWLQMN